MPKSFNQEQNELLELTLDSLLSIYSLDKTREKEFDVFGGRPLTLEFFITPQCNQHCDYCYLVKNGNKLYPKEIRDNKTILNNLKAYLDYLIEVKHITTIPRIDLFSGEIWGWPLGNQVLDILLDYVENKNLKIIDIVIPSNCSFCMHPELVNIIEMYIQEFDLNQVNLLFSCSIDGFLLDPISRPLNKGKKDLEYYKPIIDFCKKHNYGYHPMIAAENIENQIENYNLWIEYLKTEYPDTCHLQLGHIMQLEVRDDVWTDEKIKHYLRWLNHLINVDYDFFFQSNINNFRGFVFNFEKSDEIAPNFGKSYVPYVTYKANPYPSCSLGSSIIIRLGDLSVIPCHRTCYEKFNFGKYIVEDGKITGLEANNIPLMNATYYTGMFSKPKCDTCFWNLHCIKGCWGAQYEANGELFYPCETVCNLEIAKIIFLYEKYKKMGLFEKGKYPHRMPPKTVELYNKIEETEEYRKWKTFIQSIV